MKIRRLFYGLALASIAFAISSFGINAVLNSDIISVKTKPEAIQAKFNPITDASSYKAYIKSSGDYIELDSELIFVKNDYVEVNAVGLTNGTYSLKLVPIINNNEVESSKIELSNISVDKDDRSGYAHFNYTDGVGAYNDDGTLKDNAIKVYVNESNKNTVTATVNGKERTGIAEIIKNAKSSSESLDIRIIGEVGAATWNQIEYDPNGTYRANKNLPISNVVDKNGNRMPKSNLSQEEILEGGYNTLNESYTSKLNGLTNKIKYESEDKGYDSNYNMLDLDGVKNVTVEGIGSDASIFQWGFNWKRSYYIEVKNLTFNNYPEDACSFEGIETTVSKTTTSFDVDDIACGNYWVHNCTFNQGKNYWDVSKEQDKHEGDGATDFKYLRNATISYNHYYQNHKTGLVGGSESNVTANITFHHNWYQENQSRMPYARQANMHMYNNYYDSSTGDTMQIYAGAYAFIESCYFKNDKRAFVLNDKGYNTPAIKSFNNVFDYSISKNAAYYYLDGLTGTSGNIVHTDNRATHVSNGNIFNQNFDTDSSFFYLNTNGSTKVTRMDAASTLPSLLPTISGVKFNDTTYTIVQEQEAEDDNYVIYDSLLDVDFKNETISSSEVSKGLYYSYSNGESADLNNIQIVDDRLYIYDNSSNETAGTTDGYYVFENSYNSGIIKYIVEFSAPSSGSWTMLTFEGSTQIGIGTNKNEKRLSYKVGNNDQVVLLNNAMKDNKKNKVILTIDYDNNIANININGTQSSDFSYSSAINKLHFKTANKDKRSFYVDSISVMKEGTQVSGLDINTGYQMGQYSVQGTSYKAVRIIGKYEYSELFDDISDIDYINIRFDIYDSLGNFFNSITVKITDVYLSLLDSNSNVLAPEKDNVRYFYAVINGITSSYNGYVINGTTIISANNKIIESSVSLTLEV